MPRHLRGLAGGLCLLGFARSALGSNVFFRTVISSGAASFTALLLVQGGIGVSLWAATIGALMPLGARYGADQCHAGDHGRAT